jgi:hypothetical protein
MVLVNSFQNSREFEKFPQGLRPTRVNTRIFIGPATLRASFVSQGVFPSKNQLPVNAPKKGCLKQLPVNAPKKGCLKQQSCRKVYHRRNDLSTLSRMGRLRLQFSRAFEKFDRASGRPELKNDFDRSRDVTSEKISTGTLLISNLAENSKNFHRASGRPVSPATNEKISTGPSADPSENTNCL